MTRSTVLQLLILLLYVCYCYLSYGYVLSAQMIASEDFPAHIALAAELREQLLHARLVFYSTSSFTGWSAFAFYGFLWSLLVALCSYPLSLFTENPIVAAANLSLFLGILLLPLAIRAVANAGLRACYPNQQKLCARIQPLLLLACTSFSIWYLQHDGQYFGIGAGAYLVIGLAPQLFGHLLLLSSIALALTIADQGEYKRSLLLAILLCLLIWTHLLTAVYCLGFIALLSLIWLRNAKALWRGIVVGLLLSAWWLLPAVSLLGANTLPDPYPPQGDFLRLIYRYPLQQILSTLWNAPKSLIADIQFFPLLFDVVLLLCFLHPEVRKAKLLRSLLLAILLSVLFLSSPFTAESIPFGFHYYRFHSYSLLLLLACCSLVLALASIERVAETRSITMRPVVTLLLCGVLVAATVSSIRLPSLEVLQAGHTSKGVHYQILSRVLSHIAGPHSRGRVFVEYGNDYKRLPYLSGHYLDARIASDTERQALGGLFVESSLRFRYAAVALERLGANVFAPYLIFSKGYQGTKTSLLRTLQHFGVSTIVANSPAFISSLQELNFESEKVGPYHIFDLADGVAPAIHPAEKVQIAYHDPDEMLAYTYLSFYFAARSDLFSGVTLFEAKELTQLPTGTSYVLSTKPKVAQTQTKVPVLPLSIPSEPLNHYAPHYSTAPSIDRYRRVAAMLDAHGELWQNYISRARESASAMDVDSGSPALQWDTNSQLFSISGLTKGSLYNLNYSYSPFFFCEQGCVLFRGETNNLAILATSAEARVQFSYLRHTSTIIGLLLSICSLLLVVVFWRKNR